MILAIKKMAGEMVTAWSKFWFDSKSESYLYSLAAFRVLFSVTLFFFVLSRTGDLSFLYSDSGIFPAAYAKTLEPMKYSYSIFFYLKSDLALYASHWILLFSLIMLALGAFTRLFAIVAYFLILMFIGRNPTAMFGVDMISAFYFFYLMFSDSGARWSVDARRKKNADNGSPIGFVAYRLMQIQLCVVYGYSGIEKLKGVRWWDGSAMWDVLSIGTMQRWDMSFVAHVPIVLSIMAYTVLAWEIYFPALIWNKSIKNYVLAFGVLMHIGIGVFMNLPTFAAMMISYYALFLTKEELFKLIPNRN